MRRVLFSVVVCLCACSEPPANSLRFGLQSAPVTLDPRFATDATSARINRLLYRRLVDFDKAFQPIPALADWIQISPTHYRFTLRSQNRRFHDGTMLNAIDVKATYDSVLDEKTGSPHRGALQLIKRIGITDKNTIDFFLKRADPLFPGYLVVGIVPSRLLLANHPLRNAPIGSGAFTFDSWPDDGILKLIRRNDQQDLSFVVVKNPTVRVLKLLRGEIDMLQNDLPKELAHYLTKRDDMRIMRANGSNYTYLGFNLEDALTGQQKLRQAIAYAIDREQIIRYLMDSGARLANGFFAPEHWASDAKLQGYRYDPQQAKQLLQQLGYDRTNRVKITYKTSTDPFRMRIATIIQSQLHTVGIDVDLQSYDWGTFYGDIKAGRFQMYSLTWVGIKTPDIYHYVFHSSSVWPNGANRGRYRNTAADRLIENAANEQNLALQATIYRRLQRLLLQDLPYIPLWYEDHFYASRKRVNDFRLARDGNWDALEHVQLTAQ